MGGGTLLRWVLHLAVANGVSRCAAADTAADAEAARLGGLLLAALRRSTGFTDRQLQATAEELLELPPPSQRPVWEEHVHCEKGSCAGEAAARLMVQLAEGEKMPLRGFEPFKGDPLFKLWRLRDTQEFHSWTSGESATDDAPLASLVPEGQPLASGRLQAAEFTRRAKRDILKILNRDGDPRAETHIFGRCLEWDSPFYTVKAFGELCLFHDVLQYANEEAGMEVRMDTYQYGTRKIQVDVMALPTWVRPDWGVIVCLFVMEHVPDPKAATQGIVKLMRTGGFLLVGAPFLDGVHACPHDYYRYTPAGLRYLVESEGLEVIRQYSPGDPASAAGEFLGMKSSYWKTEGHLLEESDTHPINVFILARKPWSGRHEWSSRPSPKRRKRLAQPNRTLQYMSGKPEL